jgi:hypothetical protein
VGPTKLKKISMASTEMQATTILGVLGRSEQLQLLDHSVRSPRARKWDEGYIRTGTLVR